MRAASEAYNREPVPHALGICQARNDDNGNPAGVLIRISAEYLGTAMIAHELHHAASTIYRMDCVTDGDLATDHLTHHNEQAAHLHSDLLERLMTRLYALGYYEE
ncbi:hypothetical protein [Plantibacter sp. YIM 135249]|uniref:hypothetical protein n=1 Tax=Plantibacter sp. YIM 135249 TaxID=3423918 RepID=UPI003D3457C5